MLYELYTNIKLNIMNLLKPSCVLIFSLFIFINCKAQENLKNLDVLLGTWKVENKSTHESWTKVSDSEFEGISYKLIGVDKKVSENLSIQIIDNQVMYHATVKNQNQGKTISFELNSKEKELLSFENLNHDFPKKIQYKVITNDKLLVNVLGENNQGFSYYLIRK